MLSYILLGANLVTDMNIFNEIVKKFSSSLYFMEL